MKSKVFHGFKEIMDEYFPGKKRVSVSVIVDEDASPEQICTALRQEVSKMYDNLKTPEMELERISRKIAKKSVA